MQNTIHCNGSDFPSEGKMKTADVNVYIHDSGMLATHDYSCPICREKHAVLSMTDGIMKPCWDCQKKGYQTIKVEKSWWTRTLFNMLTGKELR